MSKDKSEPPQAPDKINPVAQQTSYATPPADSLSGARQDVAPPIQSGLSPRDPGGLKLPSEFGGAKGPEPTRYGDWERKGRCIDF